MLRGDQFYPRVVSGLTPDSGGLVHEVHEPLSLGRGEVDVKVSPSGPVMPIVNRPVPALKAGWLSARALSLLDLVIFAIVIAAYLMRERNSFAKKGARSGGRAPSRFRACAGRGFRRCADDPWPFERGQNGHSKWSPELKWLNSCQRSQMIDPEPSENPM